MKHSEITIRPGKIGDLTEMQKLYVDTITTVCKDDYSPEQLKAWTSSIENRQRWTDILTSQYILIAELDNKIVGYITLHNNNYIDLLFVHKDYQRQGIADKLYVEMEKEAIKQKGTFLSADVSKTARPFFEKKRFVIIQEQTNIRQGVEIINYKMSKQT